MARPPTVLEMSAPPITIQKKANDNRLLLTLLFGIGIILIGVLGFLVVKVLKPPPGSAPEERSHTRNSEEELVKNFILNNVADSKRVVFTKWGPHILKKEFKELLEEGGIEELLKLAAKKEPAVKIIKEMGVIRVCFHGQEFHDPWQFMPFDKTGDLTTSRDFLFLVMGKFVFFIAENKSGDNWKKEVRKELAKRFPGIKVDRP